MRILICTTHGLLADALQAELRQLGHRVLVASSVDDAAQRLTAELVDVCLLHLRPPVDLRSSELVADVHGACPRAAVVLLTDRADPVIAMAARRAGAAEVLTTSKGLTSLLAALGAHCRPARAAPPTRTVSAVSGPGALTARENEVLVLISRGASTTEAAGVLQVAPSTVRGHTQRVLEKLGVHSRLQAAAFATSAGLVQPEPPAWIAVLPVAYPSVPAMRAPMPVERC